MIARLTICLMFCAALASAQTSQPSDPLYTNSEPNGRMWRSLPDSSRLFFLTGYLSGVEIGISFMGGGNEARNSLIPAPLTHGEVKESLDSFYRQPENVLLGLHVALQVVGMRLNGATSAEIEAKLARERRFAQSPTP